VRSASCVAVTKTEDDVVSAVKILAMRPSRSYSIGLAVGCLTILLLSVGVQSSWGEGGTGTPLALGYIDSDGQTSIVEFVAEEPLHEEFASATALGVPAEPQGHKLVRLTNAKRANQGLPPLKVASELTEAAQFHSNWMASRDCFEHNCPGEPDWVQRIVNAGYLNYSHLGENIAAGYASAKDVVQAWMKSPGHRDNMLNSDYREAGGGYAYSADSKYHRYWTMDFGVRNDGQGNLVYPVVINGEAWSTTSLDVQLYVYGQGWAQDMRFRSEGGTWSNWQQYSCDKTWTLSVGSGSPAVVYAQIRQGSTVLEASDEIQLDSYLSVSPTTLVYLWSKGSPHAVPVEYKMSIDTHDGWTAVPDQDWIKLSQSSGTGQASVNVYLEGFPTRAGIHSGTIIVQSSQVTVEVQVTLCVTNEALQEGHVPLTARG
jgi:uncharacterized protein YkwD